MSTPPRLVYLLQSAQRRLQLRIAQEQSCPPSATAITPAQAGLLLALAQQDGATMGDLAHCLALVPSAISGLVQRMEAQHWVQSRTCTQDARTQRVWLQPAGSELLPNIRSALQRINADLRTGFNAQELATVARWLRHIQQLPLHAVHACVPTSP